MISDTKKVIKTIVANFLSPDQFFPFIVKKFITSNIVLWLGYGGVFQVKFANSWTIAERAQWYLKMKTRLQLSKNISNVKIKYKTHLRLKQWFAILIFYTFINIVFLHPSVSLYTRRVFVLALKNFGGNFVFKLLTEII